MNTQQTTRRLLLNASLVLAMLLTACDISEDLRIAFDGSGTYRGRISIEKQYAEVLTEIRKKAAAGNYKILEEGENATQRFITIGKDYRNLAELSDSDSEFSLAIDDSGVLQKTYRLRLKLQAVAGAGFTRKLRIEFPVKVQQSNNGTVSGNTVTWDCSTGGTLEARAVGLAIPLTPNQRALAVGILGAGALALFVAIRRRKPAPLKCEGCGRTLGLSAKFCRACGRQVAQAAVEPHVPTQASLSEAPQTSQSGSAAPGPASRPSPADQIPTSAQVTAPPPVTGQAPVPVTAAPPPPIRQAGKPAPGRRRWTTVAIVIVAVVVVAILVAGGVAYRQVYSFNARIDKALGENQLFSPPGSCVADIYAAKKASSPNSSDLASAAAKIREKLTPIGEEALRKWYVDSEGVDWDHAEKVYGFLQEVAPNDPAIKVRHDYVNAQIKLQNRDYSTALTFYQQSLSGDPKFVLALNGIAKVYIQDGSPLKNEQLALDYYNRVIQTDPSFTWAYKNISEYHMRKEDWPQAEVYMLRALATSPQRPSILRALARIYFNMNRLPEALDYNQRYVMVAKDPDGIAKAQAAITQIRQKLGR